MNDPDLIQDIKQGKTVFSYHEDKADSDKPINIGNNGKRIIRNLD
jgi:hypothetical protein